MHTDDIVRKNSGRQFGGSTWRISRVLSTDPLGMVRCRSGAYMEEVPTSDLRIVAVHDEIIEDVDLLEAVRNMLREERNVTDFPHLRPPGAVFWDIFPRVMGDALIAEDSVHVHEDIEELEDEEAPATAIEPGQPNYEMHMELENALARQRHERDVRNIQRLHGGNPVRADRAVVERFKGPGQDKYEDIEF